MMFTVRDLLSESMTCVSSDMRIENVVHEILADGVSEAYVVDSDQRLLGVISDFEILKAQLNGCNETVTAEQLMNCHVETIDTKQRIAEAAVRLRTSFISRLAIVEEGRLLGVVTRHAVMRMMAALEATTHPEITDELFEEELETVEATSTSDASQQTSEEVPAETQHSHETPVRKPAFLRERSNAARDIYMSMTSGDQWG